MSEPSATASVARGETARRRAGDSFIYWFCWTAVLILGTLVYRLRRFGMRRLPSTGPVLIVANHQSHLDPPLIAALSPSRPLHFIARVGLFKHRGFARLITALNSIPINEDGEADLGAIREALARLERGEVVLIFAEGSRSPDGSVHEFMRGVTLLVKRAKCPVIPAAIEGAFDAWPRGTGFPRLWGHRVAVKLGAPIAHAELMKDGADEALRRLARDVDALRLELRAKLRSATNGKRPRAGAGDRACDPSAWYRA